MSTISRPRGIEVDVELEADHPSARALGGSLCVAPNVMPNETPVVSSSNIHHHPIMIARIWHGRVPRSKADVYEQYIRDTGLADYQRVSGNRGVYLLRRDDGDVAHFTTLTFWDSVEAIKAFAGEDYERARYYPEDDEFLLEREPLVTHHAVVEF